MAKTKVTPESIIRALNVHKANGLIRDWRHNANAPWPGGTRRPFYLVVELVGTPDHSVDLKNLREASLFCNALASAHHGMMARGNRITGGTQNGPVIQAGGDVTGVQFP